MIQTETHVGWQDYFAVIMRRRWFFLAPCLVIIVGAMLVGMMLPKVYRAETLLLVEDQNVINPLIQGLAVSTPVQERLRTLREELLSWTSLSRLVAELKLDRQTKSPVAFEQLIKRLQQDVQVRMRSSDLVSIGYEDRDPKLAQTLVNTVTNIYMDRNAQSQTAETETAISFIESEMGVYKKKLEDAERALRDFKELYAMQMPVATQLNRQIIDLEVAMAQLLVENTEEHPTVVSIRRRIDDLKRTRNEEIRRVIAQAMAKGHAAEFYRDLAQALEQPPSAKADEDPSVRAAKQAYQAWVNRLDSPATPTQAAPQIVVATRENPEPISSIPSASLSLAPREEQELARLSRDYEVYKATYQHMQERLERAKITQRLGESEEGTKFKVLEPARLPLRPVRPNLWKIFFFSLTLGMFLGAAAAFVAEYLDQSFQSSKELEDALELPVLGSVSTIITDGDIEARRQRRKHLVSAQEHVNRFRTYVVQPIWSRVDRALVRWGL